MKLDMIEKEEKKEVFPVMLYNRGGDVTQVCHDLGMSRQTWRNWIEEDEDFALACMEITESLIDLGLGKLVENVRMGKSKDIHYLLSKLGKHRGFGDKVEVEHTGMIDHRHAHAHRHYPPEPKSLAEWEAQIEQAAQARQIEQGEDGANIDSEGANQALEAKTLIDAGGGGEDGADGENALTVTMA